MRTLLRKRDLKWQPIEVRARVEDVLQLVTSDDALRGVTLLTD